jgi:predicted RNA-binding Zn-ribbon protein involved in translation (DUF1610 family)
VDRGAATVYTAPVKSRRDLVLGEIAVAKGLVTRARLEECMQVQRENGNDRRPLGEILLERGLITKRDLDGLLAAQEERLKALEEYKKMQKVEYLFGQLLVKTNKATQLQINKCLVKQQELAEKGAKPLPRLGELLVEHGFVDRETVAEILRMQDKDLLFCTGCGRQFNVLATERGKVYRCKECGGTMVRKSLLDSLRAEDTTFGFELPTEER